MTTFPYCTINLGNGAETIESTDPIIVDSTIELIHEIERVKDKCSRYYDDAKYNARLDLEYEGEVKDEREYLIRRTAQHMADENMIECSSFRIACKISERYARKRMLSDDPKRKKKIRRAINRKNGISPRMVRKRLSGRCNRKSHWIAGS